MQKEFIIRDRQYLVSKTTRKPIINGVPHQEIEIKKQEVDRDDKLNGYQVRHGHVPARATWAQIEQHVRENF